MRIEARYSSTSLWQGENLYKYDLRLIDTTSVWGNLPFVYGWGTLVADFLPSEINAFSFVQYLPASIEPPYITGTPPGTPRLYLVGAKLGGMYIPYPTKNVSDWLDAVLRLAGVTQAEAYFVEQEPYNYPLIPPELEVPDNWYRVPDFGPLHPNAPRVPWTGTTLQTIYYRNSQTMVCEFYPEFLFPWEGAIPGPSHFLSYLHEPGWVPQILGNSIRMQKVGSAYGGREEYLLNNELFNLPDYVDYEWTYLPPSPPYSAGEQEIWRMQLLVPGPGEEPIIDHDPDPVPPPPGKLPDNIILPPPSQKKPTPIKKVLPTIDIGHFGPYGVLSGKTDEDIYMNGDQLTMNGEDIYHA